MVGGRPRTHVYVRLQDCPDKHILLGLYKAQRFGPMCCCSYDMGVLPLLGPP